MGETDAGPLVVELDLDPLVCMAMSSGVSRDGCGLTMTLGSLSADGWGCVPTLLVVWAEASQHWSLQTVGWGQVSVPRRHHVERAHAKEYSLGASTTRVLAPAMGHSQPPPPQETLQDPQVGLSQAHVESLLCPGSQCT